MNKSNFILFGQGNYNTLGVLHQLAEINIRPLIISVGNPKDTKNGNIIGYSKYAKDIMTVNTDGEGMEWLLKHKDEFSTGSIIYPTSDSIERLLDDNYDILSEKFRFPNAGCRGAVSGLMDKHLQTDKAEQAGLRILKSQYTNSPDFSYNDVVYPCMLKPLNSTEGAKGDMKVCHDERELRQAIADAKYTKDFIVQQYIQNEADLLFLGVALDNGEVWIPAVVIKPGVSPTGEYTHAIVSTDIDKYLPDKIEAINFVKSICYKGPFSIEFGLEKGKNYFFEINLRNDGTSHYPLSAGVNIAEVYISGSIPSEIAVCEYEMIDEVGDIRRVLYKELNLSEWCAKIRNAGAYRWYRKGDRGLMCPLAVMSVSRITDKLVRLLHK